MAKSNRSKVILQCEGSTYRYHVTKNKKTTPDKLQFKKYDPIQRKHVVFTEKK
ncbi:MAG: 50S ribosomal protein L33 [Myxococcales bacterium]|nr:MAG: 50S ribosomal protein L33 [Myxococcales bacterium]